jgi:hypothetical protein
MLFFTITLFVATLILINNENEKLLFWYHYHIYTLVAPVSKHYHVCGARTAYLKNQEPKRS